MRKDCALTKSHLCSNLSDARSAPTLLFHKYHIWELSNEVIYDPLPQGVSKVKIWQVKVENIYIYLIKVEVSTLTCRISDTPWGKGSWRTSFESTKYGTYDRRGLSCGSTFSFYQDYLKSNNLLQKRGFVDSLRFKRLKLI